MCIRDRAETYEYLNSHLPNVGDTVTTIDGCKGEVQSINVLRQLVKVLIEVNDEKELREYKDVYKRQFLHRLPGSSIQSGSGKIRK